jgi:hypothetical protein
MSWNLFFGSYSFHFHLFFLVEIHRFALKGGVEREGGFGVSWPYDATLMKTFSF